MKAAAIMWVCWTGWLLSALAQLPNPLLDGVFPPGGQAGSTVEVTLSGSDLDESNRLEFSHPGIQADPAMIPADEIWPEPRQNGLKFQVRIGKGVPEGLYEVRAQGRFGISSSRLFHVGPAGDPGEWVKPSNSGHDLESATEMKLEQLASARATEHLADYYRVDLEEGQSVVVHCWARRIDSRMDASLTLLDSEGRELAGSRNALGTDPLLAFTAEQKGRYYIKVHDAMFDGGNLYPYRLTVSARPYVQSVFPLAGQAGTRQKFELFGHNLPVASVELEIPQEGDSLPTTGGQIVGSLAETFAFSLEHSNRVQIGIARTPVAVDPQELVPVPGEVHGRFEFAGNLDRYHFEATKGKAYWLEVIADRQGMGLDPDLAVEQILKAEDGSESYKLITRSDDLALSSGVQGFDARTRDSGVRFTAPADGLYRVTLLDHSGRLEPHLGYRLLVEEAAPDFTLVAVKDRNYLDSKQAYPGSVRLRPGETTVVRVLVLREGGFEGVIQLSARALPDGVKVLPSQIWERSDEGYLILQASPEAAAQEVNLEIVGTHGDLQRVAHTGALSWGTPDYARFPLHSRAVANLPLEVTTQEKVLLTLGPKEHKVYEVALGQTLEVPLQWNRDERVKGDISLVPVGLPAFGRPPTITIKEKDTESVAKISFKVDGNNKPFASSGAFVLKATATARYQVNPEAVERLTRWKKSIDAKVEEWKAGESDDRLKQAEAVQKQVDALLKAATDRVKERDLKFSTWSQPIQIRIVDPPAEKK